MPSDEYKQLGEKQMNTIQRIMAAVAVTSSPYKYNQVLASLSRDSVTQWAQKAGSRAN